MPRPAEIEVEECAAPNGSYSLSAALGEAGQAAALAQGADAVAAPGEDLVRIGLVADVPDQPVARGVEVLVQGNGQLDDAEARHPGGRRSPTPHRWFPGAAHPRAGAGPFRARARRSAGVSHVVEQGRLGGLSHALSSTSAASADGIPAMQGICGSSSPTIRSGHYSPKDVRRGNVHSLLKPVAEQELRGNSASLLRLERLRAGWLARPG